MEDYLHIVDYNYLIVNQIEKLLLIDLEQKEKEKKMEHLY